MYTRVYQMSAVIIVRHEKDAARPSVVIALFAPSDDENGRVTRRE